MNYKEVMKTFNLDEKELNQLCDNVAAELKEFDEKPEEERKKDFIHMYVAQMTVKRIFDAIHETPQEQMLENASNEFIGQVMAAMGLFTILGAHVGWMGPKGD